MSSFHRKALFAAVIAGLSAAASYPSSTSVRGRTSVSDPRYETYHHKTGYSKQKQMKVKHGASGRKKKSKHRPQKHRVKKKSKQ